MRAGRIIAPDTDHPNATGAGRQRGFALLLVLWGLVLVALLLSVVTASGRRDITDAMAARDVAAAEAAADAAIAETIWHVLDGGGDAWPLADGRHVLREGAATVEVEISDDRGKVDINQALPTLTEALLAVLGVDRSQAHDLAVAISEWHSQAAGPDGDPQVGSAYRMQGLVWGPPGVEFQTLDELLLVRGMTRPIYQALLPNITLALEQSPWGGRAAAGVVPPAPVAAALVRAKQAGGLNLDQADPRGPQVFGVRVRVLGPGATRFSRRALVRLDGTLSGSAWKYRVLDLE